jgi:glycosyltransferase involved in cell wall biosynthesis
MQITLAHLAPTPFAQQVGRALFEANMLHCFATTLVTQPEAAWVRALTPLAKQFRIDLPRQLSRRAITEFPSSLVSTHPWYEILRLLVASNDKDKRLTDLVFHWGRDAFEQWVSSQMLTGADAVYGYEYNSLSIFETAKQLGMACIYDIPSAEHDFVEALFAEELQIYPELNTPYRQMAKRTREARTQRRREEWHLADVIMTNSEFTKASYAAAGLDVTKVRAVPLGAPPICPEALNHNPADHHSTRFLWAGKFTLLKGAHYLLQAWNQLKPTVDIRLDVFGTLDLSNLLLQNIPDSIHFSPTIPRADLFEQYRRADVLVFPTLCDGFGMVVTEAFAQGLPVITTNRAGAADLVKHGVNGLIVPAGDVGALAEALEWCITHRTELQAMRQAALETAANWQWAHYRLAFIENLKGGLHAAGFTP